MLKLLMEYDIGPGSSLLEHYVKSEANGEKNVYISGVFTVADEKNRNGRVYPFTILQREMIKLHEKANGPDLLMGALDHPPTPDYNLADSAFRIMSIQQDTKRPKYFIGEGKILGDTEKGRTAKALAKEGLKFGVSTRAVGNVLDQDGVQMVDESLNMITVDIVHDPSCQQAYMKTFMEGAEYFIDTKTGYIKEATESMKMKEKINNIPKAKLTEGLTEVFKEFLDSAFSVNEKKKTEAKKFKKGDKVCVKKKCAVGDKGDVYEIAEEPSHIYMPYLIKKWGKRLEHTISFKDLNENFEILDFNPKKEQEEKVKSDTQMIVENTSKLLTESNVSYASLEYLGENKCMVKTGKKESFSQKKKIAGMKKKLKGKATVKESLKNGEYTAEITLIEAKPTVDQVKSEAKEETDKK